MCQGHLDQTITACSTPWMDVVHLLSDGHGVDMNPMKASKVLRDVRVTFHIQVKQGYRKFAPSHTYSDSDCCVLCLAGYT